MQTTDVDTATAADDLIGNAAGVTVRVTVDGLAAQIAADGPVATDLAGLRDEDAALDARITASEVNIADVETRLTAQEALTFAAAPIYADTAAGLAATSEGDQFRVETDDASTIAHYVYDHGAGSVAELVSAVPAADALSTKADAADQTATQGQLDDLSDLLTVAGGATTETAGYIGDLSAAALPSTTTGTAQIVDPDPAAISGTITAVQVVSNTGGDAYIRVFDKAGDDFTMVDEVVLTCVVGLNTFTAALAVTAGQYIGFVGQGVLAKGANTAPGYYVGGTTASPNFTDATATYTDEIGVQITVTGAAELNSKHDAPIAALDVRITALEGGGAPAAAGDALTDPKVLFFGVGGQSNAEGPSGVTAISTRQEFEAQSFENSQSSLLPARAPDGGASEFPGFGAGSEFRRLMMATGYPLHTDPLSAVVIGRHGKSATAIASLQQGSNTYNASLAQVSAAAAHAVGLGADLLHLGQLWHQGERDAVLGTDPADYTTDLIALAADYDADVTALLSDGRQHPTWVTQTASKVTGGGYPIPLAQLAGHLQSELVQIVAPTYFLPHHDDVHYAAAGHRLIGAYAARALFEFAAAGRFYRPLYVVDQYIDGNDIVLIYSRAGLAADTALVPAQPQSGFTVTDDLDADVTVSAVTVSDNQVRLTCASAPQSGWSWAYGSVSATGMSPFVGGAGNIRDDAGNTEAFEGTPLHNWALLQGGDL